MRISKKQLQEMIQKEAKKQLQEQIDWEFPDERQFMEDVEGVHDRIQELIRDAENFEMYAWMKALRQAEAALNRQINIELEDKP